MYTRRKHSASPSTLPLRAPLSPRSQPLNRPTLRKATLIQQLKLLPISTWISWGLALVLIIVVTIFAYQISQFRHQMIQLKANQKAQVTQTIARSPSLTTTTNELIKTSVNIPFPPKNIQYTPITEADVLKELTDRGIDLSILQAETHEAIFNPSKQTANKPK